jgi:hypothetical protein
MIKHWEWGEENKNNRQTHLHWLLYGIGEWGMVAEALIPPLWIEGGMAEKLTMEIPFFD